MRNPDFLLLAAVGMIMILSILILSSASASLSQAKFHDSYYLLRHQLLWGVLPGLILGSIAYFLPLNFLRKAAPVFLLLTIVLLMLVFVPSFALKAGGAQRWVQFGDSSVQPSEILKLTFILYLASWLASRTQDRPFARKKNKSGSGFGSTLLAFLAVVALIGVFLILQPDISTFGIVAVVAVCMYFLSNTPFHHTFFIGLLGVALLLALVYFEPYRFSRLESWRSPEIDPMGTNFQPTQALIILGSGGMFGQGFGTSSGKYGLLPELIGDSIFAPYAHETGFVGCMAIVALFSFFAWRGFRIAKKTDDKFARLVACGITFWIILQAAINIASTARLIPLSGVPLPFMSYGGTAIVVELAAVGILLNISSRHAERA